MLRRVLTIVLAVAVLGGAALFAYHKLSKRTPEITYDTTKATRGRLVTHVTATGTLSALVTVLVGTQVSGRIAEIKVDYNSQVKKGDVLAKIDQQLFLAAVEQNKANVLQARGALAKSKANAENADKQYERSKELNKEGLLGTADLETAEANAKAAHADIEAQEGSLAQAEANLKQAKINLDFTTIVSPIDGVVISRAVDVGQTVAASLSAPTLFTIAQDLRKMQVDTNVAEADVGKLTEGMTATFTVDAYPNTRFRGTVTEVRNAATTIQNVVTYDAVIVVENPDLKLKPGMTANVSFTTGDRPDVIQIPNAALRFQPPPEVQALAASSTMLPAAPAPSGDVALAAEANSAAAPHPSASAATPTPAPSASSGHRGGGRGGKRGPPDRREVWLLDNGKPRMVQIRIGLSDGTNTELLEGDVKEGDALIIDASVPNGAKPASSAPARVPRF